MITHHREVKKHRTLGSINSCCLMNARNLGMSKMKCLLPNSRGRLQMDSLLKQRALVTFPISFHFAVLKDGGSWLGTQVPPMEAWKSNIINGAFGSSRKRSLGSDSISSPALWDGRSVPTAMEPCGTALSCAFLLLHLGESWAQQTLICLTAFSQASQQSVNFWAPSDVSYKIPHMVWLWDNSAGCSLLSLPAKTRVHCQVWGLPCRDAGVGVLWEPGHTPSRVENTALHTASSCLGKNISVMHNHTSDVIFRISSQICPFKWNATGLLSLAANGISFGGYFSAHFPRKERQWIRPSLYFSDIQLWFLWSQRKDWKSLVHPRTKWKAKNTNSY